jgi:hypothetical protein
MTTSPAASASTGKQGVQDTAASRKDRRQGRRFSIDFIRSSGTFMPRMPTTRWFAST